MSGFFLISFLAQASAPPDEIYDIIVLAPEKPIWPLVFYLVLALLVLSGIGWLIWYVVRSRKSDITTETPALKAARQLRQLELDHAGLDPNHFSLALSETLKDFLSETFSDPVRFETTEEFLGRIARIGTKMPPAAQQELRDFLTAAEEVKFGHAPDAATKTLPLLSKAKNLVSLCLSINSPG